MADTPRRRSLIFGALVALIVAVWLVGQAATLRWQVYHLVTHTPEVVENEASGGGANSAAAPR